MKKLLPALLLCASALRAQEEPTPFWLPPPPPAKKSVKKKPVRVKPPAVKRKKAPPADKKEPPPQETRTPEPTWIEATPREEAPVRAAPPAAPERPVEAEPRPPEPVRPAAPPAEAGRPPSPAPAAGIPPEPLPGPAAEAPPTFTAGALLGGWGKSLSDGPGRSWQPAYGVRVGYGFLSGRLVLELHLVRAGGSSGSPFVNASAAHNLAALRALWVFGGRLALLVGGGGGVVLSQTHYALQDVGAPPTGQEAKAIKIVMEITAAGRARLFRGLDARVEVSGVLRDGRFELLPLFGLGAAF